MSRHDYGATETAVPVAPARLYQSTVGGTRPVSGTRLGVKRVGLLDLVGDVDGVMLLLMPVVVYITFMQLYTWLCFFYPNQLHVTACFLSLMVLFLTFSAPESQLRVKTYYKGVTAVLAIALGSCAGWYINERYAVLYWASTYGETYGNVLPVETAASHADATVLDWNHEAYVSTENYIYYHPLTDPRRYCVAPIMQPEQDNDIQYWAVGTDCCDKKTGASGKYLCDAAESPGPHSGVVVVNLGDVTTEADHYRDAIRMLMSNSELRAAPDALLVRFVKTEDVASTINENWHKAHLAMFVATLIGSIPFLVGGTVAAKSFRMLVPGKGKR